MYFFKPIQRIIILRTKSIVAHFPSLRWLNIRVEETPNDNALKFIPEGRHIMGNFKGLNFKQQVEVRCPLAKKLYLIAGVSSIFYGPDFITITKFQQSICDWDQIKPKVVELLRDFFDSHLIQEGNKPITKEAEEDAIMLETLEKNLIPKTKESIKIYEKIKNIIDLKIRPLLLEDGGDIQFEDFNTVSGTVMVRLLGSCQNCTATEKTLKSGIENILKFYLPEVKDMKTTDYPTDIIKTEYEKLRKRDKKENEIMNDNLKPKPPQEQVVQKMDEKPKMTIKNELVLNEIKMPLLNELKENQSDNQISLDFFVPPEIESEAELCIKKMVDTLHDVCMKHSTLVPDDNSASTTTNKPIENLTTPEISQIKEMYETIASNTYEKLQLFFDKQKDKDLNLEDQIEIIKIISNESIERLNDLKSQLQNENGSNACIEEIQKDIKLIEATAFNGYDQLINLDKESNNYEKLIKILNLQPNVDLNEKTNYFLTNIKKNVENEMDPIRKEKAINYDNINQEILNTIDLLSVIRDKSLDQIDLIEHSNDIEKEIINQICKQKEQHLDQLIEKFYQGEDIDDICKGLEIEKKIINHINNETLNYWKKCPLKTNLIANDEKIENEEQKKMENLQNFNSLVDHYDNEEKIEEILQDFNIESDTCDTPLKQMFKWIHDSDQTKLDKQFYLKELKAMNEITMVPGNRLNNDVLDNLIDKFLEKQNKQRNIDLANFTCNQEMVEKKDESECNDLILDEEDSTSMKVMIQKEIQEYEKNKINKEPTLKIDEEFINILMEQNKTMNKLMNVLSSWSEEQNNLNKNMNNQFNDLSKCLKVISEHNQEIHDNRDKKIKKNKNNNNIINNKNKNKNNNNENIDNNNTLALANESKITKDFENNLKNYLIDIKNNIEREPVKEKLMIDDVRDLLTEIGDLLGMKLVPKSIEEDELKENNLMKLDNKKLKSNHLSGYYSKKFSQMILLLETECHNLSITIEEFETLLKETDLGPLQDSKFNNSFKDKIQNMRSRKKIQEHQRYLARLVMDSAHEFTQMEKHVNEMRDALLYLENELDILKDTAKESRREFDVLDGKSREYLRSKEKILSYLSFAKMILENDKSVNTKEDSESLFNNEFEMVFSHPKSEILNMDKICMQAAVAKKEFDAQESIKNLKVSDNLKRVTYQQIIRPDMENHFNIPIKSETQEKVLNILDNIQNLKKQNDSKDCKSGRYYIENEKNYIKNSPETLSLPNSSTSTLKMNEKNTLVLDSQVNLKEKELNLRKFVHKQ